MDAPTHAEELVIDCSIMARWVLPDEEYSAEAFHMLQDARVGAIELVAPDLLPSEIGSAMLRAVRRARISQEDALANIDTLLSFPLLLHPSGGLVTRAFRIAQDHNQRIYDCFYVSLAELLRVEFWTGDERLHNALQAACPCVRFLPDYTPRRDVQDTGTGRQPPRQE